MLVGCAPPSSHSDEQDDTGDQDARESRQQRDQRLLGARRRGGRNRRVDDGHLTGR